MKIRKAQKLLKHICGGSFLNVPKRTMEPLANTGAWTMPKIAKSIQMEQSDSEYNNPRSIPLIEQETEICHKQ